MSTIQKLNGFDLDDEVFFLHNFDDLEDEISQQLSLNSNTYVYLY